MLERRSFLLAATGAFVLGGTALRARADGNGGELALQDPEDALKAMLRLQHRVDGRDAPWWYLGRIFAMLPGREPIPLFRFEGLEISRMTLLPGGEYAATGTTTTFFLDWRTKEPLVTFANPVSGRTNTVQPNLIGGKPGSAAAFYSAKGVRPGRVAPADWQPKGLDLSWDYHDDQVWLSHDRVYPPGLPQPVGEASIARARVADLTDPGRDFVPAGFSSTYFAPYPRWMEMEGQPGYVVWHADGLKLESVERLPKRFRAWMERRHPERLSAPPYLV
jgi:hypothetical protein